jgi:hypothetical protein
MSILARPPNVDAEAAAFLLYDGLLWTPVRELAAAPGPFPQHHRRVHPRWPMTGFQSILEHLAEDQT